MVTRAIVFFLPSEARAPVDVLRRQFDPLVTIPPHITLVFPFQSALATEHVQAHMEQVVRSFPLFPIRLHGITGHDQTYLFLNVKQGNDALIALHDQLYTACLAPYFTAALTYTPHVTVGHVPDPRVFPMALATARRVVIDMYLIVDHIALYQIPSDGKGEIACSVPLGTQ